MVLRDARVQWGEFADNRLTQTASAIIDGQFTPTPADPFTYRFQLTQQPSQGAANNKSPAGNTLVNVTGTWDILNNRFTAAAQDIVLSDALRDVLPRQVRDWWNAHNLRGRFAQLWISFDNELGPVIGADLDRVSMRMLATPRADGPAYPVNLTDLRGSLRFGVSKASVDANVRGRLLGYDFEASGAVAGAAPDSPLDLHLRFPNAVLGEDYPPLFVAFPGSQDLIQRIAPHGKFDVSIGLNRIGGTRDIHLDGNIFCDNARMRFGHFPFPLDHVKGHVRFNENTVMFDNVSANADESTVHIEGTTGTTPANTAIDFRVWSDDAVFDDRLAACLPGDFKAIWDRFVIQARGKFNCLVKRPAGATGAPDIHVDLTLTDGSGYPKDFPYHFSHAHGNLVLTADQSYVNDFQIATAADNSGIIHFNGIIRHPGGNVRNLMPELHASADVPLDTSLLNAIPEQYADKLKNFDLSGRCGFDGIFQRKPAGDPAKSADAPLDVAGNVTLRQTAVRSHDGSIDLRDLAAAARLSGTHLDLQTATAHLFNNLLISADGTIELAQPSAHLQLAAHGRDVVLPAQAPALLPDAMRQTWSAFRPQGKIDVDANAVVHTEDGPTTPPASASAATTAPAASSPLPASPSTITPAPSFPIPSPSPTPPGPRPSTTSRAASSFPPEKSPSSRSPPAPASSPSPAMALTEPIPGECSPSASATADGLPVPWLAKLPGDLSHFLIDHKIAAQFRLNVDSLERSAADKPWKFDAELAARNPHHGQFPRHRRRSHRPHHQRHMEQRLRLHRHAHRRQRQLHRKPRHPSGRRHHGLQRSIPATRQHRRQSCRRRRPGKHDPPLRNHRRSRLRPRIRRHPHAPRCRPHPSRPPQIRHRRGTQTLRLRPRLRHPRRPGSLRPACRSHRPRRTPHLRRQTLQRPPRHGPHAARHTPPPRRPRLRPGLHELLPPRQQNYLRKNPPPEPPASTSPGAGTMSLSNKALDLNFVTESPNELKRPLISSLVNEIRSQLLQLSVTGTIDNPKITPVPFTPLANPLRALLPKKKIPS